MSIRFSYATFLTSIIVFFIISICAVVYMKSKKGLFSKFEVFCLIACFGVLNIRLLLPFEYPFTYSVYIPDIYFTTYLPGMNFQLFSFSCISFSVRHFRI